MSARKVCNQLAEIKIKYLLLNRYAQLGMPMAYRVG